MNRNKVNCFTILIVAASTIISCKREFPPESLAPDSTSLRAIHIGLYSDNGAAGIDKVESMLIQLGCNYSMINRDTILMGNLSSYDIILFPGGDMWIYKSHLAAAGVKKIEEYVRRGGGYVGICGGSYFAAAKIVWRGWADEPRQYLTITGLGIFSGTADGPIEDYAPSYQDNNCTVTIDQNHLITSNTSQHIDYLYSFGPKFAIADSSSVSILGRSAAGNHPVVLAIQYEQGRVFLTSLHPEYDDDKSSWIMMRNAILWCSNKL